MVHILFATENSIFLKQCHGWFDVNGTYRFQSVFEKDFPQNHLFLGFGNTQQVTISMCNFVR